VKTGTIRVNKKEGVLRVLLKVLLGAGLMVRASAACAEEGGFAESSMTPTAPDSDAQQPSKQFINPAAVRDGSHWVCFRSIRSSLPPVRCDFPRIAFLTRHPLRLSYTCGACDRPMRRHAEESRPAQKSKGRAMPSLIDDVIHLLGWSFPWTMECCRLAGPRRGKLGAYYRWRSAPLDEPLLPARFAR
jgi:hypothetical protein